MKNPDPHPMTKDQANDLADAILTIEPGDSLDSLGIEWLCDRLTDGESQTAIARKLGIGIASLSRWIAAEPERSARAREARIAAARAFEERAAEVIEEAKDPFSLAKAKELAHHYRWKASKANPREYGEKIEIDQRTTVTDLTDAALDARLAAIEAKKRQAEDAGVASPDAG